MLPHPTTPAPSLTTLLTTPLTHPPQDTLYEEAALLRARELELKDRLGGAPEAAPVVPVVQAAHIEAVVAAWSGVPVEQLDLDDRQRLLGLADALKVGKWRAGVRVEARGGGLLGRDTRSEPRAARVLPNRQAAACGSCRHLPGRHPQGRVVGQEDAAEAAARAIMRASSGLKNPQRPIATLLFSGPTGVGKTELTKVCNGWGMGGCSGDGGCMHGLLACKWVGTGGDVDG